MWSLAVPTTMAFSVYAKSLRKSAVLGRSSTLKKTLSLRAWRAGLAMRSVHSASNSSLKLSASCFLRVSPNRMHCPLLIWQHLMMLCPMCILRDWLFVSLTPLIVCSFCGWHTCTCFVASTQGQSSFLLCIHQV